MKTPNTITRQSLVVIQTLVLLSTCACLCVLARADTSSGYDHGAIFSYSQRSRRRTLLLRKSLSHAHDRSSLLHRRNRNMHAVMGVPRGGENQLFKTASEILLADSSSGSNTPGDSMADYSDAAQNLFGNLMSPAAMLTGGLVPLGFLASPIPGNKRSDKVLRSVYMLLSVLSVSNELLAIMYATVASNKLVETTTAPAASVFALIQRDYELSWIGTNIHFLVGLCGFLGMVGIRAYTLFPPPLQKPSAGLGVSFLALSLSIINRGIFEGDGRGHQMGNSGSLVTFCGRYLQLLWGEVKCHNIGFVQIASMAGVIVSMLYALHAIIFMTIPRQQQQQIVNDEATTPMTAKQQQLQARKLIGRQ